VSEGIPPAWLGASTTEIAPRGMIAAAQARDGVSEEPDCQSIVASCIRAAISCRPLRAEGARTQGCAQRTAGDGEPSARP
jgi:hypothetical protein